MYSVYILTDVGGAFGDGQVGADAPGSALVVFFAAGAVRTRGVVLTLTAQLPLLQHTAVCMQVTLTPENHNNNIFYF